MADVINIQNSNHKLHNELESEEEDDGKLSELRAIQTAKLAESYKLCLQMVEQMINDKTVEMMEYFENKTDAKFGSVHECTFYAAISVYLATVNLMPEDIAKAVEVTRECVEYCNQRRRKWTLSSAVAQVLRIKPNYNAYTEEEVQAEICYAGLMIMRGVLNFIRDNNFFTMITGSLRLKMAHQSFRLCKQLMDNRKWDNSELGTAFMQGTKFGLGIYNVILAQVPKRILRILEFIGFTGDREGGLQMLREGCDSSELQSIGGLLCFAFIAMYYLLLRYILGNGSSDEEIQSLEPIIQRFTQRYPDSAAIAYLNGRLQCLKGNYSEAVVWLQKSIDKDTKRVTVQLFSIWEMSFCHIMQGEPRKAAQLIQRMRLEVNVSKCCFAYMEAIYLLSADDVNDEDRKYAVELLQITPDLMAEYCGKHVPFEKFCARKARQYFAQDNFIFLPEYEVLYAFNAFFLLKYFPGKLESIIEKVEQHLLNMESRKEWNFYTDNCCLGLFIKGLCLKYLGHPEEAYDCFQQVISRENDIFSDVYLVMCSHLEAGVLAKDSGRLDDAIKHFKLAKKRRMFWVEFRIHQAKDDAERLFKARENKKSG